MNKQELIKFWTWCGFTQYPIGRKNFHYEQTKKVMDWIAPKGHYGNMGYLPRLELSEIYEYAIPKLQDKGYSIELLATNIDNRNRFKCEIRKFPEEYTTIFADNPIDALYTAILKVIDKETK